MTQCEIHLNTYNIVNIVVERVTVWCEQFSITLKCAKTGIKRSKTELLKYCAN